MHAFSINKSIGTALLGLGLIALLSPSVTAGEAPRNKLNINPVWSFTLGDPADASKPDFDDRGWDIVSLPHSHELYAADISNFRGKEDVKEPYVAFPGRKVGWYRRTIDIPATALSGKVFLVFHSEITADGGDMTRVLLQLVDKNGTVIVNNYEPVNFSIEGAGLLVGENPTQLMAGQCIILVRSTFEPGKMTISAEMPGMEGIGKASVSLKSVAVAANAHVDMPKTTVKAPTGKTVMPTNLKQIQVNLSPDDFGWFVIPAAENAEPGQLVESKPMLVSGQRQTSKLTVQGCEYRIYSSAWSSAPTEVTRGDALFFRMKANPAAGQTATAEVTIQGVKRTFTVTTK